MSSFIHLNLTVVDLIIISYYVVGPFVMVPTMAIRALRGRGLARILASVAALTALLMIADFEYGFFIAPGALLPLLILPLIAVGFWLLSALHSGRWSYWLDVIVVAGPPLALAVFAIGS